MGKGYKKQIGYDTYYSEQLTATERSNYVKHLETQNRINRKFGLETTTTTKKKKKKGGMPATRKILKKAFGKKK